MGLLFDLGFWGLGFRVWGLGLEHGQAIIEELDWHVRPMCFSIFGGILVFRRHELKTFKFFELKFAILGRLELLLQSYVGTM